MNVGNGGVSGPVEGNVMVLAGGCGGTGSGIIARITATTSAAEFGKLGIIDQ